ncbi:MAG: hypothetical protein IT535_04440 [Bauldia sp.]|nr:hypothetical protein [Bauldia sp.]
MVDFAAINKAALEALPLVLSIVAPGGHTEGAEYVALNPTRLDRRKGSFKVNTRTGRWADFATGERGGDVVSLCAYVWRIGQRASALRLSQMLKGHPRG